MVVSPNNSNDNSKSLSVTTAIPRCGESPDNELKISPRWLIFSPEHSYRTPVYTTFTVENVDPFPVAYVIKSRDRHFPWLSQGHGFVNAKSKVTITLVLPSRGDWPQDVLDYTNKRHKLVFENVRISPELFKATTLPDQNRVARDVFRETPPLTRYYTKMSFVVRRPSDVTSSDHKSRSPINTEKAV